VRVSDSSDRADLLAQLIARTRASWMSISDRDRLARFDAASQLARQRSSRFDAGRRGAPRLEISVIELRERRGRSTTSTRTPLSSTVLLECAGPPAVLSGHLEPQAQLSP
jgi:hypothetical protein